MCVSACGNSRTSKNVCPDPVFPNERVMQEMEDRFPGHTEPAFWYFDIIEQQEKLDIIKRER